MKKVLLITKKNDILKSEPDIAKRDLHGYEIMFQMGTENEVEFFRVSTDNINLKEQTFKNSWQYNNGWFVNKNRSALNEIDLFYMKSEIKNFGEDVKHFDQIISKKAIIDSHELHDLANNKFKHYLLFSDIMSETDYVDTETKLEIVLKKYQNKEFVVKQLSGVGGSTVYKLNEKKLKSEIKKETIFYPFIIQKIIKTKGIPWLDEEETISDLRLVIVNSEIVLAISRTAPKNDNFYTNVSKGGGVRKVALSKLDNNVLKKVNIIKNRLLKHFPVNHVALDFMYDMDGKPILVELNSKPGLFLFSEGSDGEEREYYFKQLILNNLK